ncbi:MAG: hypothetical protein Q8L51_03940 [Candidatus Amesbacteria bacterium]|nr:hypothetical protein [Candidatus Amesbacteria bacterium]
MNNINISELIWDEFNSEHISKHNVAIYEVNEACQNVLQTSEAKLGRISVVAKTKSGRYLTMILAHKGDDSYYPVSVRDSNKNEKTK